MTAGQMLLTGSARVILPAVLRAESFFERTRGLLGRPSPTKGEGMLFPDCRSIHTIGMAYPIDLIFLDRQECIIGLYPALKPYRLTLCRKATMALELACGEIERFGLRIGDQLVWQPK